MCGIVASVSGRGVVEGDKVRRAVASLRHRGPDAQTVWVSARGRAALGHARLSIIDLETGDQPIANEDEAAAARRQRRVLRLRAHPRRARVARPRLPHAVRQRDRAASLRGARRAASSHALRGEFAFAIWDERDGDAVRRARPLRHQAALLRGPRGTLPPRVGGEGARGARRAAGAGIREALYDVHFVSHPPDRIAVRRASTSCRPAATLVTDGEHVRVDAVLGLGLPAWSARTSRRRRPPRVDRAAARTRSTRRCACGCAPTSRSRAT